MRLPELFDRQMNLLGILHPVSLNVTRNMAPLSVATMQLPPGAPMVATGDFIRLPTPDGKAEIYRCTRTENSYGGVTIIQLDHGLVTLSDAILPGKREEEASTARAAFEAVLATQEMWRLGDVDVPDEKTLTWSYEYSNALECFTDLMDELPEYKAVFDQSALPWTVHIRALEDECASECRLTRNIATMNVLEDRTELCTRLHVQGLDDAMEADTLALYGPVERTLSGDDGLTADELRQAGQRYLDEHKHPSLSINLSALDLSRATGDSMDSFHLGRMCRVCLPDYGRTLEQRIVALNWVDVYAEPQNVRVTLAAKADSAADVLAGLIVDTKVLRKITRDDRRLILEAQEQILLRVTKDGLISAINLSPESILIDSARIDLKGYVSAEELGAQVLEVLENAEINGSLNIMGNLWTEGTLHADTITATTIYGDVDAESVTIGGSPAATQQWVNNQAFATKNDIDALKEWITANFQPKE